MFFSKIDTFLYKLNEKRGVVLFSFVIVYSIVTLSYWKKYEWNPSSMVNFGYEFAIQNKSETPSNVILFRGEPGDLGAGYDGQIFYYYSRTVTNFDLNWPKGFDESYRAPRIGYPTLIAIFGIFGPWFAILGMYFWNLVLLYISYLCLKSLLRKEIQQYALLYLLSPFALGSYYVLVSDSVMVSLVIIAYYCLQNQKNLSFVLLSSIAILTKEPALFLLFPLGLMFLVQRNWRKVLLVGSVLILPIFWHVFLSYQFPSWRATRLTEFILPFEGLISYTAQIWRSLFDQNGWKEILRLLSRFPLVILFWVTVFSALSGNWKKGWEFRMALLLNMAMVGIAGYYHFWSVYENVSRMFTITIPLFLLLWNKDERIQKREFVLLNLLILFFFLLKVTFVSKHLPYTVGF